MTEIEKLENQLYEKYIKIKNKKKKFIRVNIKSHQEEKMYMLADETGKKFDPEKYWNDKRLEQLKEQVNKKFKEHGDEEKSVKEAVDLFCKEMNSMSQFYEVAVEKVMKGDYKNAKTDLAANQLKYGYHFIIKPKIVKQAKKVDVNASPIIDDKKLADEIMQINMKSWQAHMAKVQKIQDKIKKRVSKNLDNKVKDKREKVKAITKKQSTDIKVTKEEIAEALSDVRTDVMHLSGEADLNLHQSELVRFLLNQAKVLAKKTGKNNNSYVNSSLNIYDVSLSRKDITETLNACSDFVEAVGDAYFEKKNELAELKNTDKFTPEFDEEGELDASFFNFGDEDIEDDEELISLEKELEKENAAYFEKNRRDLIYLMEHAKNTVGVNKRGASVYNYPLMGTYVDENGIKRTTHTTLIDVNYIGFGSKAKETVKNAITKKGAPDFFDEDADTVYNHGINIDPYKPVVKVSEVIIDGSSTGELEEQIFLNGYLAISDGDKYPEYKEKQNNFKITDMKPIQTHYTESANEFGIHERQESELQIFLNWIKDIFGDNWKKILNTYDFKDLLKLKEEGGTNAFSTRVESYAEIQKDLGNYQRQINNFINGSAEAVAKRAYQEALRLYNQATSGIKLNNKTPLKFDMTYTKLTTTHGVEGAAKIIAKMQKPSQSRNAVTPKSGQQILGDELFNLNYIDITRASNKKESRNVNKPINNNYQIQHNIAASNQPAVKRIFVRESGLKPFLLPKSALKNYFIKSKYGDILAACFFQILVSNTPIDEPYSGIRKRKYYTSKRVSAYKDVEINGIHVSRVNKSAQEIYQEKEANREEKIYYEYFEHIPDSSYVRNDWEFIYKGTVFKPTDPRFKGCFDKKADLNSIKTIQTVFQMHSAKSKIKSISFSYHNTNPRWEQLEYGGYVQNDNSGPWKGEGKYGFLHGVKDHFTYQAPNGWLRLIEAQWNVYMESGFDIKCVADFINQQGFNATEVGQEIIEEFNIKPREYDYKNFKVVGVI